MRPLGGAGQKDKSTDPAPSRLAWRLERLMLTPAFRSFLRLGVPLVLAGAAAGWWLSDTDRRATMMEQLSALRASIETRPEFMVQLLAVDGADDMLAQQVRAEVPLEFPLSSFDLNLEDIRDRIVALAPVRSASVRIKPGGVLQIDVVPRVPVVVWRSRKGLSLVDVDGVLLGPLATRQARPDLPLIAGVGATEHIAEALSIHRAASPLGARLRGVVRIGERRWDVVLDRDQRVQLPEEDPAQALERVIALDGAQDILARDIRRVDMRLGARPTVTMSAYATEQWWDIRQGSGQ